MKLENMLIVDDSATSRMIIKRCFTIAGFCDVTFHEAEDALRALNYLYDNIPDLIVSDLNMPKMDGLTFIKKLRVYDKTKDIPVMVISSINNETMEKSLINEGVKAIVQKPLSPTKLMEVMGGLE